MHSGRLHSGRLDGGRLDGNRGNSRLHGGYWRSGRLDWYRCGGNRSWRDWLRRDLLGHHWLGRYWRGCDRGNGRWCDHHWGRRHRRDSDWSRRDRDSYLSLGNWLNRSNHRLRLLHDSLSHWSDRDWWRNDLSSNDWRCDHGGGDWRCNRSRGDGDRLSHRRLGRDRGRDSDWNRGWRSTVRNGWNSIRRRKLRWNDVLRTHWQSHVVSMWRRCHP